jgi:hypothetical protein
VGRIREKLGTGVCNCRHLAEAHEILFQKLEHALGVVPNVEVFLYKVDFKLTEFKGA